MTALATFLADLSPVALRARNFPKRRSDQELYALLSDCLHLCQRVDREGLIDDLKTEVIQRAKARGAGRPHFQGETDAPLVVGRLVFEGEKARDATWRYTSVMRRAREEGIEPEELAGWLTENGGMNALFRTRKVERRTRSTRTLHLLDTVELPKEGVATLHLRDNGAGFYHVLGVDLEEQLEAAQ